MTTPVAALDDALAVVCPPSLFDRIDPHALNDALAVKGWTLVPTTSLPASVPAGDPRTAADEIGNLSDRQWAVWWVLKFYGPLTNESLEDRYTLFSATMTPAGPTGVEAGGRFLPPQTPQSIRSRRKELERAGLVRATDARKRTRMGRPAIVWAVTGEGRVAA